jgi:2-polyprenyl-3-methyl-5-hydroxy-6-metoxy-1,4-benzoquinol methylase
MTKYIHLALENFRRFAFVPLRPYQTTAPIIHRLKHNTLKNIWGWKPLSSLMYATPSLRQQHTQLDTNERVIEIPWIFNQLHFAKPGKVLDIGWLESSVAISLATAGFKVTGIDLRKGEISHPNLETVAGDICQNTFKTGSYDVVILLSTLEHIGLDTIYGSVPTSSTDQRAVDECFRVLKPGGKLLITTPVAKREHQDQFMRWYTIKRLQTMLQQWNNVSYELYGPQRNRLYWQKISASALPEPPSFGVALLTAEKPRRST